MLDTVMEYINKDGDFKVVVYDDERDKTWIINENKNDVKTLYGDKDGYMDVLEWVAIDYESLYYVNTDILKILEEDIDYIKDNGDNLEKLMDDLLEYGVKVEE